MSEFPQHYLAVSKQYQLFQTDKYIARARSAPWTACITR